MSERLKFCDFDFATLPDGRCRARVGLRLGEKAQFEGISEGLGSPTGELRCAAQAAVQALEQAVQGKVELELLGVKSVRAFDSTVVIVSLACREAESHRVVCSCLSEGQLTRGAALAVLNATNRMLGNLVFTR
jgi:hypothetical protein